MLGHTGNIEQTIVGLEIIDQSLKNICQLVVNEMKGTVIITADHGNCEEMIDREGNLDTKHSIYPVPFVLINDELKNKKVTNGILGDVAPTILHILGLEKPEEMTGRNLIS
jgi:2,3-bisphosphoglycerate-independent phosphoglycerate mutase